MYYQASLPGVLNQNTMLTKKINYACKSDLYIQVESVVEISTPEEMGEAQADVKGTELFLTQREQSEDVYKVLVPPECDVHYKRQ